MFLVFLGRCSNIKGNLSKSIFQIIILLVIIQRNGLAISTISIFTLAIMLLIIVLNQQLHSNIVLHPKNDIRSISIRNINMQVNKYKIVIEYRGMYSDSVIKACVSQVESIEQIYKFGDMIGEGTFACVWKAERIQNGQMVAVKQIQVHPLEKEMAYKEVQSLEKVENDHIIKYYSSMYDKSEKTLNLIMELCSKSLRKQISSKIFSPNEIMKFIVQITSAFIELQQKKLMHLDLKPQNILISINNDGYYKICDFGCAQIAIQSKLTNYNNNTFGTFNYLAPQNYILFKEKLTNTAADIWSFGVILYQMIYKTLPLKVGKDGRIQKKEMGQFFEGNFNKIVYEEASYSPPQIIHLLKKMLRPNPKNRITWLELKKQLILNYHIDEYEFSNVKKIYFKHMKLLKIFLNYIMRIRKNLQFNPHLFWQQNKKTHEQLSYILLHLCYIYCIKFKKLYSFKMNDLLKHEWIQNQMFISKHIEYEQEAFSKKNNCKKVAQCDLQYNQLCLLNSVRTVMEELAKYQEYWQVMYEMDIFCQQTIRVGQMRSSFFAAGDEECYGETMKILFINQ